MTSVAATVDISKALLIGGWMSEGELLWLATQAKTHKDVVEFGSLHGRSSRAIADNLPFDGTIFCVDPWKGDYYTEDGKDITISTYVYPYFISNLKDHIESGKCRAIRKFSYNFFLPFLVDMVFIDGDHRYETVVKDIKKALKLVRPGGLISGHDYEHSNWPGVKQAVDEAFGNNINFAGDSIWWVIKS